MHFKLMHSRRQHLDLGLFPRIHPITTISATLIFLTSFTSGCDVPSRKYFQVYFQQLLSPRQKNWLPSNIATVTKPKLSRSF